MKKPNYCHTSKCYVISKTAFPETKLICRGTPQMSLPIQKTSVTVFQTRKVSSREGKCSGQRPARPVAGAGPATPLPQPSLLLTADSQDWETYVQ